MRLFVAMCQKSFGYEDLFACLAACMSVPNSIGLATSAKMGLGRDIWTLTPFEITRVQKVGAICLSMRVNSHISFRSYTSARASTSGVPDSKNCVSCFFPPYFPFRTCTMVVLCRHSTIDWVYSKLWFCDDLCLLANPW